MRIALDHRRGNRLNDARRLKCRIAYRRRIRRRSVCRNERQVRLLRVGHRVANRNVLVALDVHHSVLLHQARVVLQRHEVRRRVVHINKNGERRLVAQVLHLALGRLHGRAFRSARARIEVRLSGALVHQHEADNRFVARGRRNARVQPHVIVFGNVVIARAAIGARSGLHHAVLAKPAVQPAIGVLAMPVVLLNDEVRGVHMVNPLGHIFNRHILALARRRIHEHGTRHGLAAEQANREVAHRANPPCVAVIVDLERLLAEHIEGVLELHIAVDVARQRLAFGILDRMLAIEAHNLGILRSHVDNDICGNALLAVLQPLEQVGVAKRAHAHRVVLVVDLAIGRRNFELAYQVGHAAHGSIAQKHGRIAVDNGDFVVVDLLNVLRELVVGRNQNVGVLLSIAREERQRQQRAYRDKRDDGNGNPRKRIERFRLRLRDAHFRRSMLVRVRAGTEEQERRQQNENADEHPRVHRVDVDGRMEPPIRHSDHDNRDNGAGDHRLFAHGREFVFHFIELFVGVEFNLRCALPRAAA